MTIEQLQKENETLKNENKRLKEKLNSIKYDDWSNKQTFEAYCLITDDEDPEQMEELKEIIEGKGFYEIWDYLEDYFYDKFIDMVRYSHLRYGIIGNFFTQVKMSEITEYLIEQIKKMEGGENNG